MKNLLLAFLMIGMTMNVFAQKGIEGIDFNKSDIERAVDIVHNSKRSSQVQQAITFFESAATDEGVDWLPVYYAAYSNALMSSMVTEAGVRDAHLNQAQTYIDEAKLISPDNDEILLVQAYIYQMRIDINPTVRAKEYTPMAQAAFKEAELINPDNPRLYFLQAQSSFFSDDLNNMGMREACPMINRAAELFNDFKPETKLHPKWGKEMNMFMIRMCERINR